MATYQIDEEDLPAKREDRVEIEIELSEELPAADPKARKRKGKRQGERISAQFESDSTQGEGYLKNVSKSGLFVRSDQLPMRGETLRVRIERTFGDWVEVEGEVRWTTQDLDVDRPVRPGFGLRILKPTRDFKVFYRELLQGDDD